MKHIVKNNYQVLVNSDLLTVDAERFDSELLKEIAFRGLEYAGSPNFEEAMEAMFAYLDFFKTRGELTPENIERSSLGASQFLQE